MKAAPARLGILLHRIVPIPGRAEMLVEGF
jgi:hypothetical protein